MGKGQIKYQVEVILRKKNPYWRIKSNNGKILAVSETYSSNYNAREIGSRLQSYLKNSVLVITRGK